EQMDAENERGRDDEPEFHSKLFGGGVLANSHDEQRSNSNISNQLGSLAYKRYKEAVLKRSNTEKPSAELKSDLAKAENDLRLCQWQAQSRSSEGSADAHVPAQAEVRKPAVAPAQAEDQPDLSHF